MDSYCALFDFCLACASRRRGCIVRYLDVERLGGKCHDVPSNVSRVRVGKLEAKLEAARSAPSSRYIPRLGRDLCIYENKTGTQLRAFIQQFQRSPRLTEQSQPSRYAGESWRSIPRPWPWRSDSLTLHPFTRYQILHTS